MLKQVFYCLLSLVILTSVGCKKKPDDPNKVYEYHISPYATQAELDKFIKDLAERDVLVQFPLLQRDETGKIQFIRCYLYSNKSWHKSFCESFAGFNDIKVIKSKYELTCSLK